MNCLTAKKENGLQIKIVRTGNKTNLCTANKRNEHTAKKKKKIPTLQTKMPSARCKQNKFSAHANVTSARCKKNQISCTLQT